MYVILNTFNRNCAHIAYGGAHIFAHTRRQTCAGQKFNLLYNLMKYYSNITNVMTWNHFHCMRENLKHILRYSVWGTLVYRCRSESELLSHILCSLLLSTLFTTSHVGKLCDTTATWSQQWFFNKIVQCHISGQRFISTLMECFMENGLNLWDLFHGLQIWHVLDFSVEFLQCL